MQVACTGLAWVDFDKDIISFSLLHESLCQPDQVHNELGSLSSFEEILQKANRHEFSLQMMNLIRDLGESPCTRFLLVRDSDEIRSVDKEGGGRIREKQGETGRKHARMEILRHLPSFPQNQNSPLCSPFKGGKPTMTMEENISGIKLWLKRERLLDSRNFLPNFVSSSLNGL